MKTLTPEERRELVYRPFPITYYGRSYLWAGTIIGDRYPRGRSGKALLAEPSDHVPTRETPYFILPDGRRMINRPRRATS